MGLNIDASEVRALAADLRRAGPAAIRPAQRAVRKTAHDIESDGKILCPVDTGNLRSSISTSVLRGGFAAEIGPTADYGHYVEHGTSVQAPQPYMRPAFDRRAPGLEAALSRIVAAIL